jgi:creatinine amidohydrolase
MSEMRTRNLCALTNYEVEEYLKRRDVIFIPVGTVELHGPLPLDCEYVLSEAFTYKLAEICDGLVLPHLVYFFPGATTIGRGTVYMSMTDGTDYLRAVAESLLSQGFRRQVFITSHAPAYQTIIPMISQFFDEMKVPLFHGDLVTLMMSSDLIGQSKIFSSEGMNLIDDMIFGAYKMLDRLEDIPLGMNLPEVVYTPESDTTGSLPDAINELYPKMMGSYYTAWYYGNKLEHGGYCKPCMTAEEREARAVRGLKMLDQMASSFDFPQKVEALRTLDKFTQESILPRYGDWLPWNKYPEPGK